MLVDLIVELQFCVTSLLQPSMAVEADKNHDSRTTADGKFDEISKLQIKFNILPFWSSGEPFGVKFLFRIG